MTTAGGAARIPCPHCAASIKAPPLPAGSSVNCPRCGKSFVLGGGALQTAAPSPVAPASNLGASSPVKRPPTPSTAVLPPTNSAAAPQQAPASAAPRAKQPDNLIDPMLVRPAPAAPAAKPAPEIRDEFGYLCKLCGSRLYAKLAQVGTPKKCPDCHQVNNVPLPDPKSLRAAAPKQRAGAEPTLQAAVERPKYQPMVRAEGEDAILALLNDPPLGAGVSPNAAQPRAQQAVADDSPAMADDVPAPPAPTQPRSQPVSPSEFRVTQSQPSSAHDEEEDDDEFTLTVSAEEPPKPKIDLEKYVKQLGPAPIEDRGSYGDELWSTGDNPSREPTRWKSSPFLIGVLEFLFYRYTLAPLIGHAGAIVGLVAITTYLVGVAAAASNGMGVVGLIAMFTFPFALWLVSFTAACLNVVQETANGSDAIEHWPTLLNGSAVNPAIFWLCGMVAAGLPGLGLGLSMVGGGAPFAMAAMAILASEVFLLPVVLAATLTEGNVFQIYSPSVPQMMKAASESWILFYMMITMLGIVMVMALGLTFAPYLAAQIVGVAMLVPCWFVYARLLGRLLWVSQKKAGI